MVSIFRSEDVAYCQLVIPYEFAYNVIRAIGELECVQFIKTNDNTPAFNRTYTQNIMWCESLELNLRFLEKKIKDEKMKPFSTSLDSADAPDSSLFNVLEKEISLVVDQLTENNSQLITMRKGFNEVKEYQYVLSNSVKFGLINDQDPETALFTNLETTFGIISQSCVTQFEQFIWRAARGNVFIRTLLIDDEIFDPETGVQIPKCVFALYTQGDQLSLKIKKICDAYQAKVFAIPSSKQEKQQILVGLITRSKEMEAVLSQTNDQRRLILNQICKNFNIWRAKVIKIKAIYASLNQFSYEHGPSTPVANCWIPVVFIELVRKTLVDIQTSEKFNIPAFLNVVSTNQLPPTYYRLNKFTRGFQNIVDAYGVASYKEVNPSLFMVITFPFLFGVMFGDLGHSLFLILAGLIMVIWEKTFSKYKNDETFGMIFSGRYIILLMGLFSFYAGLIYNDVFSKSMFLWPSSWNLPTASSNITINDVKNLASKNLSVDLNPIHFAQSSPYPLGLDPIWMFSTNKLTFTNSIKMKISVILGVIQMLFGILLSAVNHRYFGRRINFITEFIPQLLFFLSIFGYLIVIIFYKWIFFNLSMKPPSILLMLIQMFVKFGQKIPSDKLFHSRLAFVQSVLVAIAFICVPWLLCAKPIVLIRKRRRHIQDVEATNFARTSNSEDEMSVGSHNDHENQSIGEILIMQLIHTIEFVIGCISNTASYLRLWALSLAHSQLSELLWSMVLRRALAINGYFGAILIFMIGHFFIFITLLILVLMEGLSTFLHAIRLHWVEFQTKFYEGSGNPLIPFSLRELVEKNV